MNSFKSRRGRRYSGLFRNPEKLRWPRIRLLLPPGVRSALVVEDDEDIARILEFMLERDGFGVRRGRKARNS